MSGDEPPPPPGAFAERLRRQYGEDVDPEISLDAAVADSADSSDSTREQPSGFSAEVLERLATHGLKQTRYRVKGEVARGGMGAILEVWDEDLRRNLAMKVVLGREPEGDEHAQAQDIDPRSLGRFLEEAQVTGQLDHPGIVPVYELGLDDAGHVYFTMRLVKGVELLEIFERVRRAVEGWTVTRALGLLLKVCEAMAFAHAKGVIHRDLKPANVMVGRFGEVYVMDWGLARVMGREDTRDVRLKTELTAASLSVVESERRPDDSDSADEALYTMDGDVVGTPAYMSPEQARGQVQELDARTDVYAMGAMLYHLLAGQMPFVPPDARVSARMVLMRALDGPPKALSELAPTAPAELVAICDKAMAREAEARYADMEELAEDLRAFLEQRVVAAYQSGAWAEARKWVQRNKPLAAALALALLLLVAGVAASLALKARADANAALAQRNEEAAHEQQAIAEANEELARAETAKVLRLSDVKLLQELESDADSLWPAHPDQIAALESWLFRADALMANLPSHRETLEEMRAGASPWSVEDKRRDRETHPRALELEEKRAELDGLIQGFERGLSPDALIATEKRVALLEPEVESLAAAVESRRTWRFSRAEDQWQHDVLSELAVGLEALPSGLLSGAEDAVTEAHGWSIPRRLAFAAELRDGYGEGGEYAGSWEEVLPRLRAAYPELAPVPKVGLVPLGPDPESGLWEFGDLATGTVPERDADGKLLLTEETGLVFVLLPGGTFTMGAQSVDSAGANYDPQARGDEGPLHEVTLSAFFLSKYEMTQGQWLRITGRNPSSYQPPSTLAPSLLHPVEQVSWTTCLETCKRLGLSLPSEAQWEYAARGGTTSAWWTGEERSTLIGAVNLADQAAKRGRATWATIEDWPELDDGYVVHAPVDHYAPNPFGLHNVHGNVWEWCLDGKSDFYSRSPLVDPVAAPSGSSDRVLRGGSFTDTAAYARSAARSNNTPEHAVYGLGLRPARASRAP